MSSTNLSISKRIPKLLDYAVYVITYSGDRLPPFYVGFVKVSRLIDKNYHGSVLSMKFKDIWKEELHQNPHLFRRKIIRTFETADEASEFEREFLRHFDAIKSTLFVNLNIGGNFGGWNKGLSRSEETKAKIRAGHLGHKHSEETKAKMSRSRKGRKLPPRSEEWIRNLANARRGHKHSEETKAKMRESHRKRSLLLNC